MLISSGPEQPFFGHARTSGIRKSVDRNEQDRVQSEPTSCDPDTRDSVAVRWEATMGRNDCRLQASNAPADRAGAQHSQSPMIADGGTVMEPPCSCEFRNCWSILLTFRNLIERIQPHLRFPSLLAAGVLSYRRGREASPVLRHAGRGLSNSEGTTGQRCLVPR